MSSLKVFLELYVTRKHLSHHRLLVSIVNDINISTEEVTNDMKRFSRWAYQWKMMFNPDLTKQAQEVIFFRKTVKPFHPHPPLPLLLSSPHFFLK